MDGIINVYKEKGFTSHDVVAVMRKIANQKKIGHTGTLDPEAEGVLPVCLGKATKLADYIMASEKQYRAMVRLGITTTTEDASGEVLEERPVDVTEEELQKALLSMEGEQMQVPPMYSALKVNGKKLYELAREGKEVERKARKVTIFGIRLLQFLPPDRAEILVDCSKGTYIRTLCADLGKRLGCGAHMETLLRTKSGRFTLENACSLEELRTLATENRLEEALLSMEEALMQYPAVTVQPRADRLMANGCKIFAPHWKQQEENLTLGQTVRGYNSQGHLMGLYTVEEAEELFLKPQKMLL